MLLKWVFKNALNNSKTVPVYRHLYTRQEPRVAQLCLPKALEFFIYFEITYQFTQFMLYSDLYRFLCF